MFNLIYVYESQRNIILYVTHERGTKKTCCNINVILLTLEEKRAIIK